MSLRAARRSGGHFRMTMALSSAVRPSLRRCAATAVTAAGLPSTASDSVEGAIAAVVHQRPAAVLAPDRTASRRIGTSSRTRVVRRGRPGGSPAPSRRWSRLGPSLDGACGSAGRQAVGQFTISGVPGARQPSTRLSAPARSAAIGFSTIVGRPRSTDAPPELRRRRGCRRRRRPRRGRRALTGRLIRSRGSRQRRGHLTFSSGRAGRAGPGQSRPRPPSRPDRSRPRARVRFGQMWS